MTEIINYDGKLAVSIGWERNWTEPQNERRIYVSRISAEERAFLLGRKVTFTGNVGVTHVGMRRFVFQLDDEKEWTPITETKAVKKPRRGKRRGCTYDWKYERGEWRRKWLS